MTDKPSFYGILPANVRYDKRLKPIVRILYCEISSLTNKWGYCTASNAYFAELYECTPTTISRYISDLKKHGYIKVERTPGVERKIYLSTPNPTEIEEESIDQTSNGGCSNDQGVLTERSRGIDQTRKGGIDQTSKHNNTSINNNKFNSKSNTHIAPPPTKNLKKKDEEEFELFWEIYDKKRDRAKCLKKWARIKREDKKKIFEVLRSYIDSTPNKKYRKDPHTRSEEVV